ncbi:MAG: hypothetical protein AAGE65_03285 [Planctomycetota bacterium]
MIRCPFEPLIAVCCACVIGVWAGPVEAAVVGQFFDEPIDIVDGQTLDIDNDGVIDLTFRRQAATDFGPQSDLSRVYHNGIETEAHTRIEWSNPIAIIDVPGGGFSVPAPRVYAEGDLIDGPTDGETSAIWTTFDETPGNQGALFRAFMFSSAQYTDGREVPSSRTVVDGRVAYVPVQLTREGELYYAWVALTSFSDPLNFDAPQSFLLLGYAFEDQPGVGIEAGAIPEPSCLAAGCFLAGLLLRRRFDASPMPRKGPLVGRLRPHQHQRGLR